MSLTLTVNGHAREFASLTAPVTLADVVVAMNLKGDRIAVEHNGEIAQRARWAEVSVTSGDRLEVVHFVGGGSTGAAVRPFLYVGCDLSSEGKRERESAREAVSRRIEAFRRPTRGNYT
jgi:sulfur carrier protein